MVADRQGRQHQGGVTFISGVYSQFELDRCDFIDVRYAPIPTKIRQRREMTRCADNGHSGMPAIRNASANN
jgi:hypothetical protein